MNESLFSERTGVPTDLIRELLEGGPADSTAELARRAGYDPRDGRVSRAMNWHVKRGWVSSVTDGSGDKRRNIKATERVGLCRSCGTVSDRQADLSTTTKVLKHLVSVALVQEVRDIPSFDGPRYRVNTAVEQLSKRGLVTIDHPSTGHGYYHCGLRPAPHVSLCLQCGQVLLGQPSTMDDALVTSP